MINLLDEQTLTIKQAARYAGRLQGKDRLHPVTVSQWMSRGLRGVRLEFARVGGTRVTSKEAIQRFSDRLTEKVDGGAVGEDVQPVSLPASKLPKDRQKDVEAALDRLRKRGVRC